MKRTLRFNLKASLKRIGLTILGFSALSLSAQMSGAYTIDASQVASANNFQNWYSFWRSLQGLSRSDGGTQHNGGVNGAVTVSVNSSLTETGGTIVFPQITGMSSTNTVTINGNGNFVAMASTYEVIQFAGGDYFTIDNLTIRNTSTGTGVKILRFYNYSDYNTISKCTLEFSGLTSGSTTAQAYVAFATSQTSNTTISSTNNGTYNTISGCLMRTTNTNSPGPGHAIIDQEGSSSYSSTPTNNTFTGNTIQNFWYYAYYSQYTNGNMFVNNDISRANSTTNNQSSTMKVIYNYYSYSTNRSTELSGNYMHDLPFAGASASQGPSTFYAFQGWYNYGNATYRMKIANNKIENIRVNGTVYYSEFYYTYYTDLNYNTVTSVNNNNGGSSTYYGWRYYYGQETNIIGNIVEKCSTSNGTTYYFYPYQHSGTWNYMEDNIVRENISNNYTYCIYPYYGNWQVNRNKVLDNKIPQNYGYIYAIQPYYVYNLKCNSNLVAGNVGYYGVNGIYAYSFNSGSYTAEIRNNTVQIDGSSSSYSYHYSYGLFCYLYYHPDIRVTGNIVSITGGYGAMPVYTYSSNPSTSYKEWNHNTYWVNNISYQYWYAGGSGTNDWAGYRASGFGGSGENFNNPMWKDAPNKDYRSTIFETQNNAPADADNLTDITKTLRNPYITDRGAMENYTDIKAVSTNFTVPSSVCAGYTTSGGTTITLENLYPTDTAEDFFVAYTVNGGAPVREKVTPGILTGQQGTVTFNTPLTLNTLGNNRIAIFIDMPDDNQSNDSFIFNTFVKPAPGGSKWTFSTKPTWAFYQYGKPNDVTVLDQPVIYDMNAPRKYTNNEYGQNPGWNASVWATTASGAPVTGATFIAPSGSTDLEYTFETTDANLEDSMITIYFKVTDNENGCDTTIKRNVLIYPTINPDFKFPAKICDGDAVLFEQLSTVRSGNMEFEWDFGTGNPADITQAPEPVFVFPGTGTYKVKMTAKTLPYGFPAWDSAMVTVSPIPTVKFTKQNACEGQNLVFTNQTTPSNSTYTWKFGDNTTSTAVSPTHMYAQTGQYTVTLVANLNGCIAEVSQRAYQFDKPKADFSLVSGTCDNETFVFDNKSTIKSGLFGSNWDFNDGTVSTEDDPEHKFATSGQKNVKLTTTSEFGCANSKTVTITVKESPRADFTNDPACSLTPTDFNNTTPPVSGAVANYNWNFGDGGTSTAESPSHAWSTLGPKTVSFTVTLDNGCEATTSKELFVGVQPNANFDAQNVCAGEPVVFENNTTWAQGDISYEWNFGDNTTSTNSDPQKAYNVTATTTYNVTLKASIAGGCSDEVTKQVTVNEGPTTCDFVANPDYAFGFYGMKTEPVNGQGQIGPQTGVEYTWIAAGGGTQKGVNGQFNFQEDGSYQITMRAKVLATGCICTQTKTVVMNRTSAKELETAGVTVYPNPNSGVFNVALTESFGSAVTIELTSLTGAVIKTVSTTNSGLVTVDAGDVADGMYIVRVSSGDRVSASRINIRR